MATLKRLVVFGILAAGGALALHRVVLACSEAPTEAVTVPALSPVSQQAFLSGDLGVIRPTFKRGVLVLTYRRLTGRAAATERIDGEPATPAGPTPVRAWVEAREAVLKTGQTLNEYGLAPERPFGEYQYFDNCTGNAFRTAAETLTTRAGKWGAESRFTRDWLKAQDVVFANCGATAAQIPDPAPADGDALLRADRAYQVAAAYFYAMDYETAATRFRAIAADRASPWQPWGRYLAARSLIRRATLLSKDDEADALLEGADQELAGLLKDASLGIMHERARRLRSYVAARWRPRQRLGELSRLLATARQPDHQDLLDYGRLFDATVSDSVTYDYDKIADVEALRAGDDMTDWILVMQGWDDSSRPSGDAARARALERWKATQSPAWLVAVLWKLRATDAEVPAALAAAAAVSRDAPGFATVTFLRARLLLERNEQDAARQVLSAVPNEPGPDFPADAINLLRAERFLLARDLGEMTRYLPRVAVASGTTFEDVTAEGGDGPPAAAPGMLDEDGSLTLDGRLPLARLAEIVESKHADERIRSAVAFAAWTRAVLVRDEALAVRLAPVLASRGGRVAGEMKRYLAATPGAKRHLAAIDLLLHEPGLSPYLGSNAEYDDFNHQGSNWWCASSQEQLEGHYLVKTGSVAGTAPTVAFPYFLALPLPSSFPDFLSAQERQTLETERRALMTAGPGPNYLADEAVKWARAEPKNPRVAEALALAVEGTRWGCSDDRTGSYSRAAFQTLHRLFPASTWARKTKYWYSGRW